MPVSPAVIFKAGLGATLLAAVAAFAAIQLQHVDVTLEVTSNIGEADCDLTWAAPGLSGGMNQETWSFHIRPDETLSRLEFGMPSSADWTCRTRDGVVSGYESGCGDAVRTVLLKRLDPDDFALC